MTAQTAASAAYIVAALLFILAPGRAVQARDAPGPATRSASPGMAIALVATIALALARGINALGLGAADRRRWLIGAAIGLCRAAPGAR